MASLLAITDEGSTIEMTTVGREGYIGVPLLYHLDRTPYRVSVEMPMTALKMEARAFVFESNHESTFRELLLHYAYVVETQLCQAVVCNLVHSVEQRLSRRLMVMSDCLESDTFEVTQEQLSIILDKHRNRISAAITNLKNKDLVQDGRGRLTVLDRKGLEELSCECYGLIKNSVAHFHDALSKSTGERIR